MAEREGEEMRIEIKERPRKENVVEVWLEREKSGNVVLYASNGYDRRSIAYFDEEAENFHVFGDDVRHFGLTFSRDGAL